MQILLDILYVIIDDQTFQGPWLVMSDVSFLESRVFKEVMQRTLLHFQVTPFHKGVVWAFVSRNMRGSSFPPMWMTFMNKILKSAQRAC